MSWFGWGKPKDDKPSALPPISGSDAIEDLIDQQETLEAKASQIDYKAEVCKNNAITFLKAGQKGKANVQKKRCAMYRKQATMLRAQANNLIQQEIALDGASSNAAVFQVSQTALRTGQSISTHIDVDDVAENADNWMNLYDDGQEVARALSEPMGMGGSEVDDDLDAEIAQMVEEAAIKEALQPEDMPSVPTTIPILTPSGGGGGAPHGGGALRKDAVIE